MSSSSSDIGQRMRILLRACHVARYGIIASSEDDHRVFWSARRSKYSRSLTARGLQRLSSRCWKSCPICFRILIVFRYCSVDLQRPKFAVGESLLVILTPGKPRKGGEIGIDCSRGIAAAQSSPSRWRSFAKLLKIVPELRPKVVFLLRLTVNFGQSRSTARSTSGPTACTKNLRNQLTQTSLIGPFCPFPPYTSSPLRL